MEKSWRKFSTSMTAKNAAHSEWACRPSQISIKPAVIIDENGGRAVRMAHLACVGSHAINGVAALHSRLLKCEVLRDFSDLWPEKFHNVTNGVTPRRFLMLINPGLTKLLNGAIGDGWTRDLEYLRALEPIAEDPAFREEWRRVKRRNKEALAAEILALLAEQPVSLPETPSG